MKKFIKGILTADVKKKLKSKVVWVSALAIIVGVVAYFTPNLSEPVKIVGTAIVSLLALFGILNNPDDRNNF